MSLLLFCLFSQNDYLCIVIFNHLLNMLSHPMWVRGLKRTSYEQYTLADKSHPMWVRGLKPFFKV